MSKSIFIIDTPACCGECPMSCTGVCKKWNRKEAKAFPKDCPLVKIQRAEHPDYCDGGRYDKGWNDCLDQILEGGLQNEY